MTTYEWRPIEEAPKDGTPVLVYVGGAHDQVSIACFNSKTGLWPSRDDYAFEKGGNPGDGEPCNVGLPTHYLAPVESASAALERLAQHLSDLETLLNAVESGKEANGVRRAVVIARKMAKELRHD